MDLQKASTWGSFGLIRLLRLRVVYSLIRVLLTHVPLD